MRSLEDVSKNEVKEPYSSFLFHGHEQHSITQIRRYSDVIPRYYCETCQDYVEPTCVWPVVPIIIFAIFIPLLLLFGVMCK